MDQELPSGPARLEPWRLQCLLNLRLDDHAEFATATTWLVDRVRRLWAELTATDPVSSRQVLLEWSAQPAQGRRWTSDPTLPTDSTASYRRLQQALARGGGGLAAEWFWAAPPDGVWRPPVDLQISARYDLAVTSVSVELRTYPDATEENIAAAETALIALLVDAVHAALPVTFGNITDDNVEHNVTAFDDATRGVATATKDPEAYARSYSWITYLSEALTGRLDSPSSLVEDHGLFRAERVGAGLFVQATEHLADHTGAAVLALRRALDPVLEVRPSLRPARGLTSGLRVVWDDGTVGPWDHGRLEGSCSQVMALRT
jgi:hypothetical protein